MNKKSILQFALAISVIGLLVALPFIGFLISQEPITQLLAELKAQGFSISDSYVNLPSATVLLSKGQFIAEAQLLRAQYGLNTIYHEGFAVYVFEPSMLKAYKLQLF